jgi:hypothetical protein
MASLRAPWETREMETQHLDDELAAVLRTLRLAQAQMQILKSQYKKNATVANEIENLAVALEMIVKKLGLLES